MAKNDNNKKRPQEIKIPEAAKRLAKLSYKKFKKENKDYYESKKEVKKAYYAEVIDYLPESITFLVRNGHLDTVKEVKEAIYGKLCDEEFIKYLSKELKKGNEFDNMKLLPILINDIAKEASRQLAAEKEKNPEAEISFDLNDLIEISTIILKDELKKMKKKGVDDALAYDVLSIIPDVSVLKKSAHFYYRSLFAVLYEHAKDKDVNFENVVKVIFAKEGKDYIPSVITFALLERKDKIGTFNDSQKKLFNDITEYCFKTMEEMDKEDIAAILKAYCDSRKQDEAKNKDTNRRYYISSLPESDYPKIIKVVQRFVDKDEKIKKYF